MKQAGGLGFFYGPSMGWYVEGFKENRIPGRENRLLADGCLFLV